MGGMNIVEEKIMFIVGIAVALIIPFGVTMYFTMDPVLGFKFAAYSLILFLTLQLSRIPYFIGTIMYLIVQVMSIYTLQHWLRMPTNIHWDFVDLHISTGLLLMMVIYLIAAAILSYFETKGATYHDGFTD